MGWKVHRILLGHRVTRHERIDQTTCYGLVREPPKKNRVTHYTCSCGMIWA